METDASDSSLGACLRQNDKPVAYLSRTLRGAEKNSGITEKEVLAAYSAVEKLQYHLVGKRFTLITDHKAIEYIKTKIEFGSARVQRWFHRFEKINFDVEYRKGAEIVTAHALSRSFYYSIFLIKSNKTNDEEIADRNIKYHRKKARKTL